MSKLKNNKALQQMLTGDHRTQTKKTFGFSDAKDKAQIRQIGEIWEEKDIHGNSTWYEQKNGYRVSTNIHPDIAKEVQKIRDTLNSFPNCRKEVCSCTQPTGLDRKFQRFVGMCEECLISYETHLKITGQFNEYALNKMKANAESFFAQADKEVEIIKAAVNDISFAGDENDVNPIEKWSFQDPEAYKQMIQQQYDKFKESTLEKFK